jgi:hypothetical protein
MKFQTFTLKIIPIISICIYACSPISAQTVNGPAKFNPATGGVNGQIEIVSNIPAAGDIKKIFLIAPTQTVDLNNVLANTFFITANPASSLDCMLKKEGVELDQSTASVPCTTTPSGGKTLVLKEYSVVIVYVNSKGSVVLNTVPVVLYDVKKAVKSNSEVEADSDEDANYYISGNITGAHKKKTAFTTKIKLQPVQQYYYHGSLRFTPVYFKLNASTAADADPDSMEIGLSFRNIFGGFAGFQGGYFDNSVKIESEKDFDNTNFVYDSRFTFLPAGIGEKNVKLLVNPFVGAEMGKNLKSPLPAAEGDGIARVLGGVNLRVAFLREGKPWANWTTSYTRRWLMSNELGYDTDDNDNLVLVQYGKAPRDYFESKFSFKAFGLANAFIAYDWGQVPPSYKKIDHRFRLGLEFRRKTVN